MGVQGVAVQLQEVARLPLEINSLFAYFRYNKVKKAFSDLS